MDIKVRTNISNELNNIEVVINAPENNEEVKRLENLIYNESHNEISKIIGTQNNNIFVINVLDIIMFYSENKYNYCKTKEGVYRIKETLYYLEENLPKNDFIRISNSVIANINNVQYFNTSVIGSMLVKFKDGTEEYVSRRRTSEIMKFLNRRG